MGRPHKIDTATITKAPAVQPRYLPQAKAAAYFGVSMPTIWRAIQAGRLKTIRIGKRQLVDLSSAGAPT